MLFSLKTDSYKIYVTYLGVLNEVRLNLLETV